MRHHAALLSLLLIPLTRSPVHADGARGAPPERPESVADLPLEELLELEVVSAATRRDQRLAEVPSAVTVLGAEEIARHGWRTLAEALGSVRGLYVSQDRNYSYLGARGFGRPGDYNSRVLLLIDGHRLNDVIYDQAPIGEEFPLALEAVERIEVVRGPASALYGSSAFFAVINVVTRRPEVDGDTQLAGSLGSFGSWTGSLRMAERSRQGLEVIAVASVLDRAGQTHFYPEFSSEPGQGVVSGADSERSERLFASLAWSRFSLQMLRGSRSKQVPTGSYATAFGDPRTRTTDTSSLIAAGWDGTLGPQATISVRATWGSYDYRGLYSYDRDPAVPPLLDSAAGAWWGTELRGELRPDARHRLGAGIELRDSYRQRQFTRDEAAGFTLLDDRASATAFALFAQDEFHLTEALTIHAGVRWDRGSASGATVNPRLAAVLTPGAGTTIKLIYGTAFRAANRYERHYDDGGISQRAAPALEPERIRSFEAIVEWNARPALQLLGSIWHYRLRDLITQSVDPDDDLLVYRNAGILHATGTEVELRGRLAGELEGRASWSWTAAREAVSHAPLSNSPAHLLRASASWPLGPGGGLRAGAELHWTSSRLTRSGDRAESFLLANLTLLAPRLGAGFDAQLALYNAFNAGYADPTSAELMQDTLPADGRSFRLRVGRRF